MKLLKKFLSEEDGIETVEVVVIIGILLGVALIFKGRITQFATDLMDKFFNW